MNLTSVTSTNSQIVTNRDSYGYYCDGNGFLQKAQPYEVRPNFVYNSNTSEYVQDGFLCEHSLTTVSTNDTDYIGYYKNVETYNNASSGGWTVSQETITGPSGDDITAFLITIPVNTTSSNWDIPLGNDLYRMPSGGTSPCWSFFIKNNNVPSGTTVQMGVPGQSLEPFDFDTLNWSTSTLSSIASDPSYAWYIYAGREEYANGWVRIGIGGYCSAGNQLANAAIETNSSTSQAEEFSFYICNINSTYESSTSYMSSYIDPGVTRKSDILTTETYYTNDTENASTFIDGSGMLVVCPAGTVRPNYSYDSTTTTWIQDGNLVETEVSSGIILPTAGTLTGVTMTLTTDTVDPTGEYGAYLVTGSSSSSNIYYPNMPLNGISVFSFFIKKNTSGLSINLEWANVSSRTFNLDTMAWASTISDTDSYSINIDTVQLSNGWMRIGISMQVSGDGRNTPPVIAFNEEGSFYMFGTNETIETKNNYMSSYIPQTGTRSADNITEYYSSTYSFNSGNEQTIRNTVATYFDYKGIMRTAEAFQNRPLYTESGSTWSRNGYLLESKSTNILDSYVNSSLSWGSATVSENTDTVNPDGTSGCYQIVFTAGDGGINSNTINYGSISTTSYVASVYIKASATPSEQVTLYIINHSSTGTEEVAASTTFSLTTDWLRYSVTCSVDHVYDMNIRVQYSYTEDINIYVWGWQIEEGSTPSSLIMSNGIATTRTSDY